MCWIFQDLGWHFFYRAGGNDFEHSRASGFAAIYYKDIAHTRWKERVVHQFSARAEAFFRTEVELTKEPRSRLTRPSGLTDAGLGLICTASLKRKILEVMGQGKQKNLAAGKERAGSWTPLRLRLALESWGWGPSSRKLLDHQMDERKTTSSPHIFQRNIGSSIPSFYCLLLVHAQRSTTKPRYHPVLDCLFHIPQRRAGSALHKGICLVVDLGASNGGTLAFSVLSFWFRVGLM